VDTTGLQRPLREQLERAARVQRSLLPDLREPVGYYHLASLYRPCETLGGDFYDLLRLPDRVVLLVSDVAGHGPEAALITMMVKAVFVQTARATSDPGSILARMNTRLHRLTPEKVYAASLIVTLHPGSSTLKLANAGLPYPLVLRHAQDTVEELKLTGLPLGLFNGRASGTYSTSELQVEPGDVVLLSSDGIGAVEGDDNACFEDKGRIKEVITSLAGRSGQTIIDELVAAAETFSNGRPLPDDINMVAITRDAEE
jgi:sigma-B regulation protein RsbU (phosphoserine phosphatase)